MGFPEIDILDVGHGNCAIIHNGDLVTVVDVAEGYTPLQLIRDRRISRLRRVIISHADDDHHAGLLTLLLAKDLVVDEILVNADARKQTAAWTRLRVAVRDARERQPSLRVTIGVTCDTDIVDTDTVVRYEILAPNPVIAMAGVGGEDLDERRLHANSMSVVLRVWIGATPVAMFCGDVDGTGLDNLLRQEVDLHAKILVFPHHGGLPRNASPRSFAAKLAAAVRPEVVVFSLGRGVHNTPRPDIVDGVRDTAPSAYIVCTQLSVRCASGVPHVIPDHLTEMPARGRRTRACCGGSLSVTVDDAGGVRFLPDHGGHARFVDSLGSGVLCRRELPVN